MTAIEQPLESSIAAHLRTAGPRLVEDGRVRTVVLHANACLIRSGQDLTDCGETERTSYVTQVEPSLRAGMDFLRDEGNGIGCYDNRYMTVLDDDDDRTGLLRVIT